MPSPYDVVVVGAGPAGALAAASLARRGARVLILDREAFPRDKLCGDTLNPGALRILARHGLAAAVERAGVPIDGMLVTSGNGVAVRGTYGRGRLGFALTRRVFDSLLLEAAVAAGAELRDNTRVLAPLVEPHRGELRVRGVCLAQGRGHSDVRAAVTIAADGRRSPLAVALGLARQPAAPRRWAIGGHFEGVTDLADLGEMHIRDDHYLGVAPLGHGLANVCLVSPAGPGFGDPAGLLRQRLAQDPLLRGRTANARQAGPVRTLGPLALDVTAAGAPGLLLAGDAAGFIDPMTGDGLRLALRGAELAADVAAQWLADPGLRGHDVLAAWRGRELATKLRVNRWLRGLTSSPRAIRLAARGARVAPEVLQLLIRYAGDVRAS